jgi:hypothetical protein
MSSLEADATARGSRRRRSAWAIVGWILVVLVVLAIVGFVALGIMVRSALPSLPDLERPEAVLSGLVRVNPDADPTGVAVRVSLSTEAVAAAAAGDGLVHLELDVAKAGDGPAPIEVGVQWRDQATAVRALTSLEPGADVRWTLRCVTDEPCEDLLDLTFGPVSEQTGAMDVEWRLVANVRPPRGTEISEDAMVMLSLVEATE